MVTSAWGKSKERWAPGVTELACGKCRVVKPKEAYGYRGLLRETTCKECKDAVRRKYGNGNR